MGNCAYHNTKPSSTNLNKLSKNVGTSNTNNKKVVMIKYFQLTVKIIDNEGKLQEFFHPLKAQEITSHHPNSFLCSAESMYIDYLLPKVEEHEELQLGQIYFLLPLSESKSPLTLKELCLLAIKASAALSDQPIMSANGVLQRTPSKIFPQRSSSRFSRNLFRQNSSRLNRKVHL